jgi:hypothetical protein
MTYPGGDDISGGQNQRLLPEIRGVTSFTPTGDFGLYSYYSDFSDERFHVNNLHNFRFYPARGPNGAVIPNAYLVVFDPSGGSAKNWDYNDLMWLMTNVTPTFATNGVSVPFERTFSAASPGTLVDRNGAGTGFSRVVGAPSGHVPADLLLSGGTLSITARAGTNDGAANNQANMLANVIDAMEVDNERITTRLNGPVCLPSDGRTEAGIFFGPDQDHVYKLVVANAGAATEIQVIREELGSRAVIATVPVSNCSTVRFIDLTLRLYAGTAKLSYQYAIFRTDGTGGTTVVGSQLFDVVHQQWWFNQASLSGVLASSTSSSGWTAVFDRWKFYLP